MQLTDLRAAGSERVTGIGVRRGQQIGGGCNPKKPSPYPEKGQTGIGFFLGFFGFFWDFLGFFGIQFC